MTPTKRFLLRCSAWGFLPMMFFWAAAVMALMLIIGQITSALLPYLLPRSQPTNWLPSSLPTSWFVLTWPLPILASLLFIGWGRWTRERFVREAPMPITAKRKLREAFPDLSSKDSDLGERALRQFFLANLRSGSGAPVAMPSILAGHLWQGFASDASAYSRWCQTAFGQVLVPTAAQSLGRNANTNDALRRTWFWACKDEAINPKNPTRLPLLFALDAKLSVAGGIVYSASSMTIHEVARQQESGGNNHFYYGTSFSSDSHSGDRENFGGADSSSSSSDSDSGSSDGGGDGGGGDGGGGGGGGGGGD